MKINEFINSVYQTKQSQLSHSNSLGHATIQRPGSSCPIETSDSLPLQQL